MSPEQIAVVTSVLSILGKWPVWASVMMVCIIGPWIALMIALRIIEKRFDAIVSEFRDEVRESNERYKSNVKLVEVAENLGKDYKELALMVNTALTTLVGLVQNNAYCPVIRNDRLSNVLTKILNENKGG